MELKKFIIIDPKQSEPLMNDEVVILMNLDHIVSIKPIKIINKSQVIDGYWVRTTNGKKYRAISVPEELLTELNAEVTIKRTLQVEDAQPASIQ